VSRAYYNENDRFAAAWLRELIATGNIAYGDVDVRDIRDVRASDLAGYTQCHFFAGIGAWSYALRLAGWPDDRAVWTGSCPCQPFSQANSKRRRSADERHLWPAWIPLIRERRPAAVFGEQVASPDGLAWLGLVYSDLEGAGYAVGSSDLCAAGVGAPHIRQRLFFVAHASGVGFGGRCRSPAGEWQRPDDRCARGVAHTASARRSELARRIGEQDSEEATQPRRLCNASELADTDEHRRRAARTNGGSTQEHDAEPRRGLGDANPTRLSIRQRQLFPDTKPIDEGRAVEQSSRAPWADVEWIECRDGKRRPTQSGIFPLAYGTPARVGRLRGYGGAIVAPLAAEFIVSAFADLERHS
jgi:DNA (cytosine-5)-methyltransferase 1